MKISHKLVGSFVSVSLLTTVVGAVAIAQSQKIAETLAIAEAEHVAQVISALIAHDAYYDKKSISIERSDELQHYTNLLHDLQKRDIVVVNRQKLILADAVPENVGTIFEHDQDNEIQQTMQDRKVRSFLEKSVDYPQGIKLIVVTLTGEQNQVEGAVILEWSSLYDQAIAQAKPTMVVIGITSLGCVILALILGLQISVLEESAQQQTKANQQTQPGKIWISTQVTADNLVQIAIADNGSGIPEAESGQIFDPFFTTKPVGKGTGLGLSISYQIVTQKHHGKIWCDSTIREGCKIVIEIPVHQPKAIPS